MAKTLKEINEKIKQGKVVVATAEEIIDIVDKKGLKEAAKTVELVMWSGRGHSTIRQ